MEKLIAIVLMIITMHDIYIVVIYNTAFTVSSRSLISLMLSKKALPNSMLSVSGQLLKQHTVIRTLSSSGL